MVTPTQWYEAFLVAYDKDKALQKLEAKLEHRGYSGEDSEWTQAIKNLLTQMATSMGYKVEDESLVHGGGRADQRWLSGGRVLSLSSMKIGMTLILMERSRSSVTMSVH